MAFVLLKKKEMQSIETKKKKRERKKKPCTCSFVFSHSLFNSNHAAASCITPRTLAAQTLTRAEKHPWANAKLHKTEEKPLIPKKHEHLDNNSGKKKALLIIKAYQMGCKEKKWRKRKKQRSRSKTDTDTCGKCRVVSCGNTSSRAEPCCGFSFVPHLSLSELLLYIVSFTKPGRALALKANEKRRVWKGGKKKRPAKKKGLPRKRIWMHWKRSVLNQRWKTVSFIAFMCI